MMYSLHDITSVCPKLEPIAVEELSGCREQEHAYLQNQSNGHVDSYTVVLPENNNTVTMATTQLDQRKRSVVDTSIPERPTANGTSIYERPTTNGTGPYERPMTNGTSPYERPTTNGTGPYDRPMTNDTSPYDVKSIGTIEAQVQDQAYSTGVSVGEMPEGHILNVYTAVPVYSNGGHEVYYYSAGPQDKRIDNQAGTGETYAYAPASYEPISRKQTDAPEGFSSYQSSAYGTIPDDQVGLKKKWQPYSMVSQENALLYQMNTYRGTHRALTPHEMATQPKHACSCSCHQSTQGSSHIPAFGLKNVRPSVIMVPSGWNDSMSQGKVESAAGGDFMRKECDDSDDSDSSDDGDGDGKHEKYFRKNIDGTTARFKLTKEEWARIPINTFPSGGRLLSGDWTRIFLSKVKESNPWCSLRFKNNHVRSENSRKIHSAVFFRGGAECKRPECNVKVRFVIRKEKGKHVDVTYVGDVCHSSQPGGSDAMSERKRKKCVRRSRFTPTLVE